LRETELHIFEEETGLLWAPVVVVTSAAATYLLSDVFVSGELAVGGIKQIAALLFILISFYGILKISDPLYHFIFHVHDKNLSIDVKKGEREIKTFHINISDIEALKFAPNELPSPGEALFDYSTTYHLMWKSRHDNKFCRLLDLGSTTFYLKVVDIVRIIRFLRFYNPEIDVPKEQASYFNL
jgi:hypothetical protein